MRSGGVGDLLASVGRVWRIDDDDVVVVVVEAGAGSGKGVYVDSKAW